MAPRAGPILVVIPGEPLALMVMPHLLSSQVESDLHKKHVIEAWGDQVQQKSKVGRGRALVLLVTRVGSQNGEHVEV